jgi:plastocyanin
MASHVRWLLSLGLLAIAFDRAAATHQVQVISFRFEPSELRIAAGDTVVWRNNGGSHNVAADDQSFRNGAPDSSAWTFSRTFAQPGTVGYYCEPHGGPGGSGMAGKIIVEAAPGGFEINPGITGTWNTPGAAGQGFLIEVVPALDSIGFGWFTWSATVRGQHDWLNALGPIQGDSATVVLQRTVGGRFNDPTPVTVESVGSATLRFTDCANGTFTYVRTDIGQSGTLVLRRLTPIPAACTSPSIPSD